MDWMPLIEKNPWFLLFAIPWFFSLWLKYREGSFGLSRQRTERLFQLVSSGAWRTADAAILQMAARDAFGRLLDDRMIRFALGRHKPLKLLIDCKRASGLIQLSQDGVNFEPHARANARRYRVRGGIIMILGVSPWILLWMIVVFALQAPKELILMLFAASVLLTPFAFWMTLCLDAAHRLIHQLEEHYPPIPAEDALAVAPTTTAD